MTQLNPQKKIDELTNIVIEMLNYRTASMFEVAKIKREVNQLLSKHQCDPAVGHMCLGLIEYYSGNYEKAITHLTNARSLAPHDVFIYMNSLAVYSDISLNDELLDLVELATSQFFHSKTALKAAIDVSLDAFQISKARSLLELYVAIDLEAKKTLPDYTKGSYIAIQRMYKEHDAKEDHVLQLLKTATETVKSTGNHIICTNSRLIGNDEFMTYLYIDADSDECATISFDIADALVSTFENSGMEYLSIVCRPIAHKIKPSLKEM